VGTQFVHHVINYRLTTITEVENLIVPGQDGGRAGRGVDLDDDDFIVLTETKFRWWKSRKRCRS
jgi:hypothetical protein